jgi:hypothetical protein
MNNSIWTRPTGCPGFFFSNSSLSIVEHQLAMKLHRHMLLPGNASFSILSHCSTHETSPIERQPTKEERKRTSNRNIKVHNWIVLVSLRARSLLCHSTRRSRRVLAKTSLVMTLRCLRCSAARRLRRSRILGWCCRMRLFAGSAAHVSKGKGVAVVLIMCLLGRNRKCADQGSASTYVCCRARDRLGRRYQELCHDFIPRMAWTLFWDSIRLPSVSGLFAVSR